MYTQVVSSKRTMGIPDLVGFALALRNSVRIPTLTNELERVGLVNMVTVLHNERDHEDGMRGCFTSHVNAISQALNTRPDVVSGSNTDDLAKYILILEDDVVFDETRGDGKTVIAALMDAITALDTQSVECVGIGGWAISRMGSEITHGVRPCAFNCAHAYVLSRAAALKIVKTFRYTTPKHKNSYG